MLKKWNTLAEASEWLSSKTSGRWSPVRIINFAIKQCREDDIVEDYKYPTYLRATFSKAKFPDIAFVALHLNDNPRFYIYDEIQLNDIEITITPVFRENLIALSAGKKTSIHYVSYDHQSKVVTFDQADPLIVFAELNEPGFAVGIPRPKFPQIPIIHINYESLGIRDAELKELLRDYLALSKKSQETVWEKTTENFGETYNSDTSSKKQEVVDSLSESDSVNPAGAVINVVNYQESDADPFSEDECSLFDPLTRRQIELLFSVVSCEDWKKFFDRALRNGLCDARQGGSTSNYKYNPAKVANWLYAKGKYRVGALARILSNNFPARSKHRQESFLEYRISHGDN